tara:strand:+ start:3548 stop:3838 length:291 start_codon:yes stop_codon:yes gene_type:complete
MARHNMVNGVKVDFTAKEETARDAEEQEWADDAPNRYMIELRRKRDDLLGETDYMGLQDFPITDAWKTYRQALRDITNQTPSDDVLSNITFPKKPS